MTSAPRRPANLLAKETSPYLLQHAHNPVDWRPWGPEAFAEARRRDVPIFLSIGYSTCYWCHVMERESFENEQIAEQMNRLFVCVKVDREERPDVDDLYMAAVQAFSGHGGWPMSVFLDPASLKPFWAGTYFPAEPKFSNVPAFPQVLDGISEAWHAQRKDVLSQADELADAVRERLAARSQPTVLGNEQVVSAVGGLLRSFDRNHGGFGGASGPKFPQPVYLELLLDARRASADAATTSAIDAALTVTLDRMAIGGMFDQVGGGFHRYSVDATWTVPHFEKMLYDNAQLASVYAKAAVVYDDTFYRTVARRTLEYVEREMTDPATGAFYSAQDAEVDGREGKNYLWSTSELVAALGKDDGEWAAKVYGVSRGPNFRDPHHPPKHGEEPANVLRLDDRPERVAAGMGMDAPAFQSRLDGINARLLTARARRKQPRLDDKTLAGWNGLMISAMASAGALLGEARFVHAAARAAGFLLDRVRSPRAPRFAHAGLFRTFRDGHAKIPAFLDDYAFVIQGLIELVRAGADPDKRFLAAATDLSAAATERFAIANGSLFDTLPDQSDLFMRTQTVFDGAVPSGTGQMVLDWLELAALAGRPADAAQAVRSLIAASAMIAAAPLGAINCTRALMRTLAEHRPLLESELARANATSADEQQRRTPQPVEILASADQIDVPKDRRVALTLRVNIAPGYHLTAADPGSTTRTVGLVPLRIQVLNGSGLTAYADYPRGRPHGADPELLVYEGSFDLPILLERSGTWEGRPLLAVTYQPCTEDACLAARSVELDVAIDPV